MNRVPGQGERQPVLAGGGCLQNYSPFNFQEKTSDTTVP
jgi:hypothetical protein